MSFTDEQKTALRSAAKLILQVLDGQTVTQSADATKDAWRDGPASDKQLAILKKNGYATDNLSKGKASDIINAIFKKGAHA